MVDRYIIAIIEKNHPTQPVKFYKGGNLAVIDPDYAMLFKSSDEAWKCVHKNGFHFHKHLIVTVDIHPEDRYA